MALEASRYIYAPLPPREPWRDEFTFGIDALEYQRLMQPLNDRLDRWPKELGDWVSDRWYRMVGERPRPITGRYFGNMQRANDDLAQLASEIDAAKLDIASSDGDLREYANKRAGWCAVYPHAAEFIVLRSGLQPPDGKRMTDEGKLLRMQDERWWRRKVRESFGQHIENTMRKKGMVCKKKAVYVTNWAVTRRASQKENNRKALKSATVVSDAGDQLSLFDLSEHSLSNPSLRRGELMTRARGFEEIAKQENHTWTFATLTCPSAFHAVNYNEKSDQCYDNPHYQGSSVRAGQTWMVKQWAKARAKLRRIHIEFYGFRVAEPHHDGTVHWHMLLFCAPHNIETLKKVIKDYWLSEYADEQGAKEYRVEFKDEDKNMPGSSAAGYLTKYIAKNIDGFEVGQDCESGLPSENTSSRVEAWSSTHRIRQFQQIGGPSIGVWRELRRIREPVTDETIEAARMATNKTPEKGADFAGFINAVGGIEVGRNTKVLLWKKPCQHKSRYREDRDMVVGGVWSALSVIVTRVKTWVIEWGRSLSGFLSDLGPVSITVRPQEVAIAPDRASRSQQKEKKLIEGTLEWWQWFKASGRGRKDMTRLSLLWN